jgi:hypothetical protein
MAISTTPGLLAAPDLRFLVAALTIFIPFPDLSSSRPTPPDATKVAHALQGVILPFPPFNPLATPAAGERSFSTCFRTVSFFVAVGLTFFLLAIVLTLHVNPRSSR